MFIFRLIKTKKLFVQSLHSLFRKYQDYQNGNSHLELQCPVWPVFVLMFTRRVVPLLFSFLFTVAFGRHLFFISFLPSLSLPFLPLPLLLSTSLYFFLSLLFFKSLVLGLKRVSVAGIYNDVIGPWRSRLRHYFQLCTVRSSPLYFLVFLFLVFNIGHCDTIVQPPEALLDGAWVIHVFCSSLPCMQGDRDWLAYTCTFLGLMEGYLYL